MNIQSMIVLAAVIAALVIAVTVTVRKKTWGCSSCSGDCPGCSKGKKCGKKK